MSPFWIIPVRRRDGLIAVGLITAVLLVYARTARFDYVLYDDHVYVFQEPRMQRGLTADNIRWALSDLHTANWHPLTLLSYLLETTVFGVRPGPIHVTNVLLHAINTALLFALLRTLTGATWPSAFVAALFGLHPLHVESVAWISERKDVLSAFFFMLTLLAYAKYMEQSKVQSPESKVVEDAFHVSRFTFHASRFYALSL